MFIVQILAIASLTMTTQTGVLNIMGFSMVLGILLVILGCWRKVLCMNK